MNTPNLQGARGSATNADDAKVGALNLQVKIDLGFPDPTKIRDGVLLNQ